MVVKQCTCLALYLIHHMTFAIIVNYVYLSFYCLMSLIIILGSHNFLGSMCFFLQETTGHYF